MHVLVVGAGVTGLAAAISLPRNLTLVLEAGHEVGGLCRTVEQDGFRFDRTGHFLHLRHSRTRKLVDRLLRGKLVRHVRRAAIYLDGHWIPHPFQAHLGCLPCDLRDECLDGFLEAHTRLARQPLENSQSLLEWFRDAFGEGITRHFLEPQNRKTYCCDLSELDPGWAPAYVPRPSPAQVVDGAQRHASMGGIGYNAEFLYPRDGGIGVLPRALAAELENVRCGTRVVEIDTKRRTALCASGESYAWDHLISTLPVNALVAMTTGLPEGLRRAAARLRAVDVLDVRLGIAGPVAVPWHWVYFPERRYPFVRVVIPSNVSATAAPPGHSAVQVEFNCPAGTALDEERCKDEGIRALRATGILPAGSRVVSVTAERIRCAYVVHDHYRKHALRRILAALREQDVSSIGRYGAWAYGGMESAMLEGMAAAESIRHGPAMPGRSFEVDSRAQLQRESPADVRV